MPVTAYKPIHALYVSGDKCIVEYKTGGKYEKLYYVVLKTTWKGSFMKTKKLTCRIAAFLMSCVLAFSPAIRAYALPVVLPAAVWELATWFFMCLGVTYTTYDMLDRCTETTPALMGALDIPEEAKQDLLASCTSAVRTGTNKLTVGRDTTKAITNAIAQKMASGRLVLGGETSVTIDSLTDYLVSRGVTLSQEETESLLNLGHGGVYGFSFNKMLHTVVTARGTGVAVSFTRYGWAGAGFSYSSNLRTGVITIYLPNVDQNGNVTNPRANFELYSYTPDILAPTSGTGLKPWEESGRGWITGTTTGMLTSLPYPGTSASSYESLMWDELAVSGSATYVWDIPADHVDAFERDSYAVITKYTDIDATGEVVGDVVIPIPQDLEDVILDAPTFPDELPDYVEDQGVIVVDPSIPGSVEDAIGRFQGSLGSYEVDLTMIFPFCLPFDLYRLLSAFSAEPVPPRFDFQFPLMNSDGTITYVSQTIDLSPFDAVAYWVRWGEKVLFIVGLAMVTRDKFLRG